METVIANTMMSISKKNSPTLCQKGLFVAHKPTTFFVCLMTSCSAMAQILMKQKYVLPAICMLFWLLRLVPITIPGINYVPNGERVYNRSLDRPGNWFY